MLTTSRTLPAMIAIGLFVVLLATGLVWWSQAWSRDAAAAREGAQCLQDVARENPVAKAKLDLERGEDRPFFAAGIAQAPGITGCSEGGAYTDNRPWPFELEPASAVCGEAADRWVRAYNGELARLDPKVSAKYCRQSLPQ